MRPVAAQRAVAFFIRQNGDSGAGNKIMPFSRLAHSGNTPPSRTIIFIFKFKIIYTIFRYPKLRGTD